MRSSLGIEIWASGVWLAVIGLALMLPLVVSLDPVSMPSALAEVALLGPLAVWLAAQAAAALSSGRWTTMRRPIPVAEHTTFFVYLATAIIISACFMAGFVRGFVSLSLFL